MVVRSLKDRLRAKFNVSVSEVDHQDLWQRSQVCVVSVGADEKFLEKVLHEAAEEAERIFGQEPAGLGIVVAGAVVIEAGEGNLRIEFASGVSERIDHATADCSQIAERVVGVGIDEGAGAIGKRCHRAQAILFVKAVHAAASFSKRLVYPGTLRVAG